MTDLEIIYEDNHLIAINKPNGTLVHTDQSGDASLEDILKDFIKEKYQKPGNVFLHSCHRLDRPVSGALIFARTSKARDRMRQLFSEHKIHKTYLALTSACPDPYEADLENWLLKNRAKNVVEIVKGQKPGAVKARTRYATLGQVGKLFVVRLHPMTGKSHQLRVHMRLAGSPILGDVKYGGESIQDPNALMLHCRRMEFLHPIRLEPVILRADLPHHPIWDKVRKQIQGIEQQE